VRNAIVDENHRLTPGSTLLKIKLRSFDLNERSGASLGHGVRTLSDGLTEGTGHERSKQQGNQQKCLLLP
jgi:hypothetical protein